MNLPEIPNFFFFSVLSGIIILILIEIFRPEILGFKDTVRKMMKIEDAKKGIVAGFVK